MSAKPREKLILKLLSKRGCTEERQKLMNEFEKIDVRERYALYTETLLPITA